MNSLRNYFYVLLFLLAAVHCTLAYFYNEVSYLDLQTYTTGKAPSPFQERVAMIPVLAWAEHSPTVSATADTLREFLERYGRGKDSLVILEPLTPEKVACMGVGVACNLCAVLLLLWTGRSKPRRPWIAAAAYLVLFTFMAIARCAQSFWYPWDLPHTLFFGAACLALLGEIPLWTFLPFFLLDLPVRETSVYLLPLAAPIFVRKWGWKSAVTVLTPLAVAWACLHFGLQARYAANHSENYAHWNQNLACLTNSLYWPQLASAFGFLWLPLWLNRNRLAATQRQFLYFALPCLLPALYYGMWMESRIFLEWSIPAAVLLADQLTHWMNQHSGTEAAQAA